MCVCVSRPRAPRRRRETTPREILAAATLREKEASDSAGAQAGNVSQRARVGGTAGGARRAGATVNERARARKVEGGPARRADLHRDPVTLDIGPDGGRSPRGAISARGPSLSPGAAPARATGAQARSILRGWLSRGGSQGAPGASARPPSARLRAGAAGRKRQKRRAHEPVSVRGPLLSAPCRARVRRVPPAPPRGVPRTGPTLERRPEHGSGQDRGREHHRGEYRAQRGGQPLAADLRR